MSALPVSKESSARTEGEPAMEDRHPEIGFMWREDADVPTLPSVLSDACPIAMNF